MIKSKICIIEDEFAIQQMYKFRLTNEGFSVYTASNGLEGLQLVKLYAPDLILLDLRMPVMSGEEMLRTLRAEQWGKSVKVIILTNIGKSEAPHALRFLSVDRYIVKAHYTPRQVTEVVREVLAI